MASDSSSSFPSSSVRRDDNTRGGQQQEDLQQQDLLNNVDLFRHGQEALSLSFTQRPANSKRTYEPRQNEWNVRRTSDSLLLYIYFVRASGLTL
jgi:hypothetical protein